jgi:hypothetical protein
MELDGSSWWFRSDFTSLPLALLLLRALGGGGGGGGRMVDEHDAVPGGEHVDEDTRGGGAITEVGIRKSLVSGMSDVDTVDIVGCIPTQAAPRTVR